MKRILILGGAGFVGSKLAGYFRERSPVVEIVVLDNLKRRGSELNLPSFRERHIEFQHGDIRVASDLNDLPGNFDVVIDCSAEPSVLAGTTGSPNYLLQTNLMATANCLDFARQRAGKFLFLSTSRVYSVLPLKELPLTETESRFVFDDHQKIIGVDGQGVREDFATSQARSFYGATKLASEMLIQEYHATYGLEALINRCGVLAGPGQFGKVDQGVFTLWVARHHFGGQLQYTGFGGQGKQVRDLLHPRDLFELVVKQIEGAVPWKAAIYNVGGGINNSVSLKELTAVCEKATGNRIAIASQPESPSVDIPWYVTNSKLASETYQWAPQRSVQDIVGEIAQWMKDEAVSLRPLFT